MSLENVSKYVSPRNIFLFSVVLNLLFYTGSLLLAGLNVHNFAGFVDIENDLALTDGAAYYKIALDPFSENPTESGFRHATFLFPLLTYLIAQGNPTVTAITMELINILAFSASISIFYMLMKIDNLPHATFFYAFNPILLISTHGAMNEPLFFACVLGSLLKLKQDNTLHSMILLSLAAIARPDFVVFAIPFFAYSLYQTKPQYLLLPITTLGILGLYLISRFSLDHFLSFTSGEEFPHRMLGIPFQTFFENRFFGTPEIARQITGLNYFINEIMTWGLFVAVIISIALAIRKRHTDNFSLTYLVFGSIIQPAYSYFSGYFRFVALAPYIYKLPCLFLRGRPLILFTLLYVIGGLSLLFAWFL